jgi:hypothetical protein
MNTYWKIDKLTRNVNDGTVTIVHWRLYGEEDGIIVSISGDYPVLSDINSPDYIQFSNLTEDIVLGWITSKVTDARMLDFEKDLKNLIEHQKTPKTSEGLPWA